MQHHCLTEKLHIIKADKHVTSMKELTSKCWHKNKYFLMNISDYNKLTNHYIYLK